MRGLRASTKTTPCTSGALGGLAAWWGSRQDAGFPHFMPSKYSLLYNGIERIVK
jgi:hypothetical protein